MKKGFGTSKRHISRLILIYAWYEWTLLKLKFEVMHEVNFLPMIASPLDHDHIRICIKIYVYKHYQNISNQSGDDHKLQYKPPNKENENRSKRNNI